MLAHEWWVRDARTDKREDSPRWSKLTDATCLYNIKILSDVREECKYRIALIFIPYLCLSALYDHLTGIFVQFPYLKLPRYHSLKKVF